MEHIVPVAAYGGSGQQTTGSYALPAPVRPVPGESLPSFVLRNSEVYEFRNPMRLLRQIQPPVSSLAALGFVNSADEFGHRLARLLSVTPDQLACMTCGTEDPKVCALLGHPLHPDLISLDARRYCPLCLRESPHHRAIWDLSLLTACPKHSVQLVRRCPSGHPVSWHTDHLHLCGRRDCRQDLRHGAIHEVPSNELSGVRGLVALLEGRRPPGLVPLEPGSIVRVCFHLGALARGHHFSPRPILFADRQPEETVRVLNDGWSAIMDWPRSFHSLLDRLRAEAAGRKGRYGLRKQFGHLPQWLTASRPEPYGPVLNDAFNRYVAEQDDLATRARAVRRFRSSDDLRHRHMTATEASALLGIAHGRLSVLAKQHDLYLLPPTGKGASSLMRADRVHALAQHRSGLLTKADVQRRLGVGKATVNKLGRDELLQTVPDVDDPDGVRYPAAGVDSLLQSIAALVPAGRRKPLNGVSIAGIARRVPRPGYDTCDVLHAIWNGSLAPAAVETKRRGLQRFLFDEADVSRFVELVTRADGRTLSVVEAAQKLGVKQEVAYHWARTGLLATTEVTSPSETGRRITQATLEAFRRDYITGAEFAQVHRLSRKWVAPNLVSAGIRPVSGPSVDGARQYLFRRPDLDGFGAQRLVSGRSKLHPETASHRRLDRKASNDLNFIMGQALRREYGNNLTHHYRGYQDLSTGTVIQVMTGSNTGTAGTYVFLITEKHRVDLSAAKRGFLALGFADRPAFLLVPWKEVATLLETMKLHQTSRGPVWRLSIRGSSDGEVSPFGEHSVPLAISGKSRGAN